MPKPDKKKPATKDAPVPRQLKVLLVMWGVFLLAVLVVMAQVLPAGGEGPSFFKVRRTKKAIVKAESMERQSLWHAAAEAYEKLAQDEKGDAALRAQASARLAGIYSDKLNQPEKAEIARERAIFLDPAQAAELGGPRKLALIPSGKDAPPAAAGISIPAPPDSTLIAKVGGADVALEEILYAWKRVHPEKEPTGAELQPFILEFMDTALLAEEARRRGSDRAPGHLMEIRFMERQLLNRELLRTIVPQADDAEIQKFYAAHSADYMRDAAIRAAHIIVREGPDADAVGRRIGAGEDFVAVAKETSLDRDQLPEGSDLGWIHESEEFIPHVGALPSLAARLARHDDGYTTGPIPSQRGLHWFKVVEKKPAAPAPLAEVRKDVESKFLKDGYNRAREELIKKLKQEIPITIEQEKLKEALAKRKPKPEKGAAPPAPPSPSPSP